MHYHIYCNIKNMAQNHLLALDEFKKRLSAYCDISLHTSTSLLFQKELNRHNHQFVYIQNGVSSYSSEQFSEYINNLQLGGKSTVHVVIGFSEVAFYEALSNLTDYATPDYFSLTSCNLSTATKTLLFYEQLYRGYTILQGKTYHK